LIEPIEQQEERIGSIIIPDTAKEKPQEGKVIAVGPGRQENGKVVPLQVKVGDRVLYGKYAGTEIKKDGKEYLIVRESDILAVIE
jgi:chaperonin GroES